jgi:RNA polymerase sigma-70 factor (ECF subfamily)
MDTACMPVTRIMEEQFPINDESLLKKTAGGDETAFRELVQRYQGAMVNLAYRYTNNLSDAEDVAAEIFFRVWKYAAHFKGNAKFSTWCYRIGINTCLNHKRKKNTVPYTASLDECQPTDEGELKREVADTASLQPETAAQDSERTAEVRAALDRLPPQQKMAFTLCWFEERSYKEIAELMELSVSAVESLLFRAKDSLRKKLMR